MSARVTTPMLFTLASIGLLTCLALSLIPLAIVRYLEKPPVSDSQIDQLIEAQTRALPTGWDWRVVWRSIDAGRQREDIEAYVVASGRCNCAQDERLSMELYEYPTSVAARWNRYPASHIWMERKALHSGPRPEPWQYVPAHADSFQIAVTGREGDWRQCRVLMRYGRHIVFVSALAAPESDLRFLEQLLRAADVEMASWE